MRFACVIRSGYLVLANQHTSSEGQGSRDLRQTRVEPYRCHGLPVYAVSVCNKVRLPGTGQSAHVIGGSRFTRPASNSRRTLLN